MPSEDRELLVPFIPGDGIGPDITIAAQTVIEAAINKTTDNRVRIKWEHLMAGQESFDTTGEWLPRVTIDRIRAVGIAIKGPLTTPVGGGIRSLNVVLRQVLDLYSSVRPVRHFRGVPSPVKNPEKMNMVIFRENTEDVYKGLEWKRGSEEIGRLRQFLRSDLGVDISEDSGLGLKPISEFASKRLIRAAMVYGIRHHRKSVTLVHKGNIMKYTEGAFRDWGYELARDEFSDVTIFEGKDGDATDIDGKILLNDRIADNMFQQILTRPDEYSVLAAPNLNGDYLADACAAQVGGLGFAPGANIGDGVAVFEPVHGTAPKYAGKDIANPSALILSGAMMLDHIGFAEAARSIEKALEMTISDGFVTWDVARQIESSRYVGTRKYAAEIVARI